MTLILSSTRIDGLSGTYAVAGLITEGDVKSAKVIYTTNARVIDMAKKLNTEVRDFPKHPPTNKKVVTPSTTPSQETKEQPLTDVLTPLVMEEIKPDDGVLTATSIPEAVKAEDMELNELREFAKGKGIKRVRNMKRETILDRLANN